jgi:hypothetical protein
MPPPDFADAHPGYELLWDRYPRFAASWERVKHRPSTDQAMWSRMGEGDWAPFRSIQDDPWPKVQTLLKAA